MKILLSTVLFISAFATAIDVIRLQHLSRSLFVEIQVLEKKRDQLNEEWGRLQLEQSTWATHDRVEEIARKALQMRNAESNLKVLLAE